MIAAWILYALLVGVLVGGGAMVLERLLRAHRLPTRGVWAGAMLLSVLWPLVHFLWEHVPWGPSGPAPLPARPVMLEPLAVQVAPESFLRVLDGPILAGWGVATALLVGAFFLLVFRTRRLRNGWAGEETAGRDVLVSEDWGPAVVGFLDPQIVLPRWCRELDEETLRLILDHEAEHLKAGDLPLLLTAGVLPMLLPWSLPLWWQLSRLRIAVEGDCDLRVLRRNPHRARPYLEILLEVAGRLPRRQVLAAMLSEPENTLERRIRIMTMPFPKNPWARGVTLAGIGAVLVALACWAPGPTDIRDDDVTQAAETPAVPDLSEGPTFTPYTVRPDITNRAEVAQALEAEYPPLLRDAGIGGTVTVWFFLDEEGTVRRAQVNESSGHEALDEAALRVARTIQFTPALNRDKEVPVWISLPITFAVAKEAIESRKVALPPSLDDSPEVARQKREAVASQREDLAAGPAFTPFTVRPDITNRAEVAQAMQAEYPPLLRDAGIGGTARVWFFLDETGATQKVQINESSGHEALDEAALRVARTIQFTPALNRDKKVPVWISLPITFTTR